MLTRSKIMSCLMTFWGSNFRGPWEKSRLATEAIQGLFSLRCLHRFWAATEGAGCSQTDSPDSTAMQKCDKQLDFVPQENTSTSTASARSVNPRVPSAGGQPRKTALAAPAQGERPFLYLLGLGVHEMQEGERRCLPPRSTPWAYRKKNQTPSPDTETCCGLAQGQKSVVSSPYDAP